MEWNLHKHEKSIQNVKSRQTEYTVGQLHTSSPTWTVCRAMNWQHIYIHFSQFHVYGTYVAPLCLPSSPISFFPILLIQLPEPMHVCKPAHVWTLQRLAIWSTFWLPTTFLFFCLWNLCSASVSTIQFPMDLCSASVSTIQPISFLSFFYEPMQRLCHPVHFFFSL